MKKNKTVAFMLAATLMVGGTFLGTKAWFTDQANSTNDLVITMGTLDVEASSNEQWEMVGTDNEGSIEGKNQAKNISPGDSMYKVITITNNGTLNQDLEIGELTKKETSTLPEGISATLQRKDENNEYKNVIYTGNGKNDTFTLAGNGTKNEEFRILVDISNSVGGDYNVGDSLNNNKSDTEKAIKLVDHYDPIVIEAVQTGGTLSK